MINNAEKAEISKALVEVQIILDHLSKEDYMKISENIHIIIDKNMDDDYEWEYNEDLTLEEQTLNKYTLAILAYINNEFLLNTEQKQYMEKLYENNNPKIQAKNVQDIFEERKTKTEIDENTSVPKANLIVYENLTWCKKLFIKIKRLFNRGFQK